MKKREINWHIGPHLMDTDSVLVVKGVYSKYRKPAIKLYNEIIQKIKKGNMKYIKEFGTKKEELFVIPKNKDEMGKVFDKINKAQEKSDNKFYEIGYATNNKGEYCFNLISYTIQDYEELKFNIEVSFYIMVLSKYVYGRIKKKVGNGILFKELDKNLVIGFLEGKCTISALGGQAYGIWEINYM